MVTSGLAVMNELEATIMKLVVGLCGLIPEVGGIISGVVTEAVETIYELANAPLTKIAILKAMHEGFDVALDTVHKAMLDNHDPALFRERAGPMGELLDLFPTRAAIILMAGEHVEDVQDGMVAYHTSVRALADALAAVN